MIQMVMMMEFMLVVVEMVVEVMLVIVEVVELSVLR